MSVTVSPALVTPGPWQVIDGHVYGADSRPEPFTDLHGVHHPNHRTHLVALVYGPAENVPLVAAAPQLLDALKVAEAALLLVVQCGPSYDWQDDPFNIADALEDALRVASGAIEAAEPQAIEPQAAEARS